MLHTLYNFCLDLLKQQNPVYISSEFRHKIQSHSKIQKYYSSKMPRVDSKTHVFQDMHDYLSTEGIATILGIKLDGYSNDRQDISNCKLIEDDAEWSVLKNYLACFTGEDILEPNESIKLMLKIKKGEPAHYDGGAYGVHVVSLYIRNVEGTIKAFMYDSSSGLLIDKKDGFHKLTSTLENFFTKHYDNNYQIIKTSTITQADATTCPISALAAMKYFVYQGANLFQDIQDNDLVKDAHKIIDKDQPRVHHLKADKLPPYLLKLTNRRSIRRVQEAYNHEWMPEKLTLNEHYYDDKDLTAHSKRQTIGNGNRTLIQSLNRQNEIKSTSSGVYYNYNTLPAQRMKKYRTQIGASLLQNGVIKLTEPTRGESQSYSVSIDHEVGQRYLRRLPLIR